MMERFRSLINDYLMINRKTGLQFLENNNILVILNFTTNKIYILPEFGWPISNGDLFLFAENPNLSNKEGNLLQYLPIIIYNGTGWEIIAKVDL